MSLKKHILILDSCIGPSIYNPVCYSDFISESDGIELLIITSIQGLSIKDKEKCLASAEIQDPFTNARLEKIALEFHEKYRIDIIYTKQEDLILRASYLRQVLNLNQGLYPPMAMLYRDKFLMKSKVVEHGIQVPPFAKIHSPLDILSFTKQHGFPVIIKPILGCASAAIKVLSNEEECNQYLEKEFYSGITDIMMDYTGNFIIEKFVPWKMFHVNGYAKNGKVSDLIWPFAYLSTNLDFTKGKAYGNVLISRQDPLWNPLVEITQKVLDALGTPQNLIFHLELFQVPTLDGSLQFALCEIAARRPGGSIGLLIDEAEGGQQLFPEMEFRLNNGLDLRQDRVHVARLFQSHFGIGDLMVPKQIGKLLSLPDPNQLTIPHLQVKIMAKIGTLYRGFDVNTMNTAVRFVAFTGNHEVPTFSLLESRLMASLAWFNRSTVYETEESFEFLDRKTSIKSTLSLSQTRLYV